MSEKALSRFHQPIAVPEELPILPLRDTVLFPNSFMPLAVARETSVRLIDEALSAGKLIGVFTQRDASVEEPAQADLYHVGTASHIQLDADTYALVLNNVREKRTEVRLVSLQRPNIVSEPVAIYRFDEVQQAVLLLDEEKDIWFMYYRTHENSYGVKTAPVTTP